ncbi:MAG: MFS transporter [Candidatus Limnocylindrales bacterium]
MLTAYYFGLSVTWGSLSTIVLPRLVEQLVPAAIKTSALSLIAGLQAIVAIVVQPISGAASDRLVTPWGRRRPLMVVGVSVQLLLLVLLALSGSYLGILVVMLCIELASNTAQGPYQGLLPDLVPPGRRGLASGFLGGAQMAGQIVGAAISGVLVVAGHVELAVIFTAASLGIGTLITVAGVEEREGRSGQPHLPRLRWQAATRDSLLDLARWERAVRTMVLEVWGGDVLEHRDYLWLLGSRLAILMAAGTLQPFAYYYLEDSIGLGGQAGTLVAPLAGAVALVALAAAIPGGAMTARWGRVRTVALSAISGAVGAAAFAVAPSYVSLFFIAIPFGLALGIFLSADWALLTDVAPLEEAGRYLGLSNTVTAASAVLAVAVGGPLADLINGMRYGAGYRAVFMLAALEFLIGAWAVTHVHEPAATPEV